MRQTERKHTSRKTLKQRNGDTKCSKQRKIRRETAQKYEAEEERGKRNEKCEGNSAIWKKKTRITKQRTMWVQEIFRKGVHKAGEQTGKRYAGRGGYLGRTIV
jgi:flagellar biosynthesis GTPase FlhF